MTGCGLQLSQVQSKLGIVQRKTGHIQAAMLNGWILNIEYVAKPKLRTTSTIG
jgi:hypothetical protein